MDLKAQGRLDVSCDRLRSTGAVWCTVVITQGDSLRLIDPNLGGGSAGCLHRWWGHFACDDDSKAAAPTIDEISVGVQANCIGEEHDCEQAASQW